MNILLTSVGRRTYMVTYFKEALKDVGQVHAANSADTYALRVADKAVLTPFIYDETYVDFLLSYCTEHNIKAIISLFDIDLPILAKNKAKFLNNGVQVVVSAFEITQICNDKWLTCQFLKENAFYTPQTYLTLDDCKKDIANGKINFPLIIKPRWGMGSIGIFQADDINELDVLYNKTKSSISESYLKFESKHDPDRSIIIQEKLSGIEHGLDVLNDLEGNFLTCIPKIKLAMRAGETDSAEIIHNSDLFDLGKRLSQKIKHIANLDVDCFEVGDKYYILEMNCRFGGQYPFSHLAGANFPKAIINMLQGKNADSDLLSVKYGTIGFKDLIPVKVN